ncbi:DNA internalization-related competence protein ComEC/Rec2 [Bacillus sp. Au-Bac7]|uniref:DNA internalization-related competence protein ComEC/Rec2 n=1 Tax=Bacillus sp. Au-Bac7 TaxID=2906458 RepID=UPI001E50469A|nr:DNA internalization-related competence protein ComEC/Rec2 [Bacillus sp. Au-Bac7]MCE4046980.1 DNA internalization-related competence protein ComEC/Rec2 [Bacillus sp. Au-Bac7]
MNFLYNNILYFAVAALLAVLLANFSSLIFLLALIVFIFFLIIVKKWTIPLLLLLVFIGAIFFYRAHLDVKNNFSSLKSTQTNFSLTIMETTKIDGDKWTAVAKDNQSDEKLLLHYQLNTFQEKLDVTEQSFLGNTCVVSGQLAQPAAAANEGMFDYQLYLKRQSIHWVLQVKDITSCKELSFDLLSAIKVLREQGIAWIEAVFSENTAPVAIALLFGDRDYIASAIQNAYQKLGIVHLLAISGSHVLLLIGLGYYFLLRVGMTKERSITIILLILPAYTVLTGLSPSVIRAVSTASLMLLQRRWRLSSYSSIDLLSIAFLGYLFLFPKIVTDIGFQLSFIVSLFLLLSTSILKGEKQPVKIYLLTAYFCELSVLPFLLSYFYELPALSLFANLVYIPLFSILLPYFILVFFLSFLLPKVTIAFLYPIDKICQLSDWLVTKTADIPYITIIFGKPNNLELILYFCFIPVFFCLYEALPHLRKRAFLIPFCLLLFQYTGEFWSKYGEVTFINVGQGDSILINEPFNRGTYIIDTGGTMEYQKEEWQERENSYEVGEDTLVPYLKSKGITKIDKLVLTHGDMDHIGGSVALIKSIPVKQILMPKSSNQPNDKEKEIWELARQKNIPVFFVGEGDGWTNGNSVFQIIAPGRNTVNSSGENDGSIVISAQIGGLSWLFTGDIEENGEEMLLAAQSNLETDVLKVAHHGSKTSTTEAFLEEVNPDIAIISAGKNNRYGHPDKGVLKRLQAKKITVWRTDVNGTISFKFSQKKGTFFLQQP